MVSDTDGLDHVDLLEATRERVILLEDAAVFLVGGRADAAQLAVGEHGLDEVGGIHDAARSRAGADDGVDLVDEEDGARLLLQLGDDALQPLLEIAAVLGAGDQRAHVERIDSAVGQHVGHLALDDHARQAFGNGGLADAGLADVQRIVLAAAAQDLDGAFHLERAADQRIDLAVLRELVEIGGVLVERAAAVAVAHRSFAAGFFLGGLLLGDLREAVRDEIDHVEARDLGAVQQVHRVALLLAEDGDEHVGDADFLLARGLHVEHGALQDALEAERRLHFAVFVVRQARRGAVEVLVERVLEPGQVRAAGAQDLAHLGGVEDRQQQVLDREELMASFARLGEGVVQTEFELLR